MTWLWTQIPLASAVLHWRPTIKGINANIHCLNSIIMHVNFMVLNRTLIMHMHLLMMMLINNRKLTEPWPRCEGDGPGLRLVFGNAFIERWLFRERLRRGNSSELWLSDLWLDASPGHATTSIESDEKIKLKEVGSVMVNVDKRNSTQSEQPNPRKSKDPVHPERRSAAKL